MSKRRLALTSTAGLALLCVVGMAEAAGEVTFTSGLNLNDPRGLAFDEKGTLYVADSGNGAVVAIRNGFSARPIKKTVLSGLDVGDDGGPEGLSFRGNNHYLVVAGSTAGHGGTGTFGRLIKFEANGDETLVADVGDYDYAFTQANLNAPFADAVEWPDANPYGVLVDDGGILVADAGANAVDEVKPNGRIRILAVLPTELVVNPFDGTVGPGDAVPTSLAKGPDGKLYVGTLRGRIYRFDPHHPGSTPVQNFGAYGNIQLLDDTHNLWLDPTTKGTQNIVGLAFGPGGLYATEIFTQGPAGGDVIRIDVQRDGRAGAVTHYGEGVLNAPNFLTIGPDGNVYVSNNSVNFGGPSPLDGEVARIAVCNDPTIRNHAGYPSKDEWCKPHDNRHDHRDGDQDRDGDEGR